MAAMTDEEFERRLRLFYGFYEMESSGISTMLKSRLDALPEKEMQRAMKSVLSDIVEMSWELDARACDKVDVLLRSEGFPGLRKLQFEQSGRIRRLLEKGKLNREEDAIILNTMIVAGVFSDEDILKADRLINDFGDRAAARQTPARPGSPDRNAVRRNNSAPGTVPD